jgi:metal-sulfur cluster biosynthetic enzyme
MSKENFDPNILGEKIVKVLKTVFDPEIPVDIYELGLIYDVMINEDRDVKHSKLSSRRIITVRC